MFVAVLDRIQRDRLKELLMQQGFVLSEPPHTAFSGKKTGISCTLYQSGKCVVQGKAAGEFLEFHFEPEILKGLSYSHPELELNLSERIGIDEAGKGDFFGPLCIAGVFANSAQIQQLQTIGVKDSKQMGDKKIEVLAGQIEAICPHQLVVLYPKKYNELYANFGNLNHLLAWGHATAIESLVAQTHCRNVIIDQFAAEHVVLNALSRKKVAVQLVQRHRAEADVVVAAASILARNAFVRGIELLSKKVGVKLPKGASQAVIAGGRQAVALHGSAILTSISKVHFKTTAQL